MTSITQKERPNIPKRETICEEGAYAVIVSPIGFHGNPHKIKRRLHSMSVHTEQMSKIREVGIGKRFGRSTLRKPNCSPKQSASPAYTKKI